MLAQGLQLLLAASVGLAHFGPDENVRVEPVGHDIRITAFGAAAQVPLLLTRTELDACISKLEREAETLCTFQQRGSIAARRVGDSHQVTFADPVNANVVDIALDKAALDKAIAVLRNPA